VERERKKWVRIEKKTEWKREKLYFMLRERERDRQTDREEETGRETMWKKKEKREITRLTEWMRKKHCLLREWEIECVWERESEKERKKQLRVEKER
jgi:hypothetical protein